MELKDFYNDFYSGMTVPQLLNVRKNLNKMVETGELDPERQVTELAFSVLDNMILCKKASESGCAV